MPYRRISDRLLDLDGRNPAPPYRRRTAAPADTHRSTHVTDTYTRPPRPTHVDDDLMAEAVRITGMKPREITDVRQTDAGLIIHTFDGSAVIDVPADRPDANGLYGLMAYPTATHPATGRPHGRLPEYADPAAPVRARAQDFEPWTLADLDQEAERVRVPAPVGGPHGPSRLAWVGDDPVRARAAWLAHLPSRDNNEARRVAATSAECGRYREIVLASGLLRADEAARL